MKIIFKVIALVLIVAGIADIITYSHPGAEISLLAGLVMFFVIKPKVDDERLSSTKSLSIYTALILGYAIKLISTNLYQHHLISWQLTEINYFLILVFTMALLIYYITLYFTSK